MAIYAYFFQLSLVEFATGAGGDNREELRKYCQLHQVEFWTCVNQTFDGEWGKNNAIKSIE